MREFLHGFSLIELMISLVVLAILITLGAPSFAEWLQNQQTRAAADATLNGLQVARAEGIRRNLPVQIVFTPPTTAWVICEAISSPPPPCDSTTPPASVIQSRIHEQSMRNASLFMTPVGTNTVIFNSLGGRRALISDPIPPFQIDVSNPAMVASTARPLRIVISPGGSVRMCDPATVAPDPRACP